VAGKGKTAPRGGQGNEAGSVYRRGTGAISATHGLRAKGIAALEMPDSGPYPEAIAFETLDAVDDIRCEVSDGTCLYLQSKRTYSKDKTFKSAVEQWMAMLERLRDGDRLVIVSAEAKGEVAALPSALRNRRAGGVLTAPEEDAIAALADAAGLSATSPRFDELCAVGHAWHASANSRFDPGYQLCAEMLDGVVVEASHGHGRHRPSRTHVRIRPADLRWTRRVSHPRECRGRWTGTAQAAVQPGRRSLADHPRECAAVGAQSRVPSDAPTGADPRARSAVPGPARGDEAARAEHW